MVTPKNVYEFRGKVRAGLRQMSQILSVPLESLQVVCPEQALADLLCDSEYGWNDAMICDTVMVSIVVDKDIPVNLDPASSYFTSDIYIVPKRQDNDLADLIAEICESADMVSLEEAQEYACVVKSRARKQDDLAEVVLALAFFDFKCALMEYGRKYQTFTQENSYHDTGMGPNGTSPLKLH